MLQLIREYAHGWIAAILVGALSIMFAMWGIQYYLHGSSASNVVAKVNGEKISSVQLQAAYQQARFQLQSQYGGAVKFTPELQKDLRKQALQNIINREVVSQAAHNNGFRISTAQMTAVIQQMPMFQINGQFSPDRYNRVLSNMAFTEQSYWRQLEQALLIGQLRIGITNSAFSLPNEVKTAVVLTDQTRDFSFVVVPVKKFIDDAKVSANEIEQYYHAHQQDYTNLPKVKIDYVEISADALKNKINITEQEVKDYYDNNQAAFSTMPRWQIQTYVEDIPDDADNKVIEAANKKIGDAAKQLASGKKFSEFTQEKPRWISPDRFNSTIILGIKGLKVGEISKPLVLSDGFTIVKVIAIEPTKVKPFAKVKDEVKELMHKQKLESQFNELSNQLSELSYTTPDTLQSVANQLGLTLHTTEFFAKDNGKSAITSNSKVINAAFSEDVLEQGNNSTLVEIKPGHVLVLRVNKHVAATVKPLKEVHDDILGQLKLTLAKKHTVEAGEQLFANIGNQKIMNIKLSEAGIKWQHQTNALRQQPGIAAQILNIAFRMPNPSVINRPSTTARALSNGDFAIVKLNKVHLDKNIQPSDAQRRVFEKSLKRGYGKLEFDLLVSGLMKQAKIKIINSQNG